MISTIIIATVLFIHIFFFIALVRKNFAIMDIAWGLGFILISLLSYVHNSPNLKNALLLFVATVWGLRLAIYILKRSRGKGEDPRYANLRAEWKPRENLNAYFKVFILQGILMLIISLPITAGMALKESSMTLINWIGLVIWLAGFSFEVWSDSYLSWWKAQPQHKGKICMTGPWRYCRFPNYFGEVLLWYGVFILAFQPPIFWAIIGPVTINFFILKVTGVPLLEEKYMKRPEYQEYAAKVPRFVPFLKV